VCFPDLRLGRGGNGGWGCCVVGVIEKKRNGGG